MFLKRYLRRKNGKVHTYWALVESVRTAKGSRHKVVTHLGELTRREKSGWDQLAKNLPPSRRPQPSLFDPPSYPEDPKLDNPLSIRLGDIGLRNVRDFGDVWLALGLWRLLGLDTLLESLMPKGREDVSWAKVAAILSVARFCCPSSERQIEEHWYRKTTLDDLLAVPVEKVHTDRLYAGLDRLYAHKESIEKHLRHRAGELFEAEFEVLIYDLTSTYFEGKAEGNAKAARGYSRDNRSDCKQVCIGLVVTPDGFPLAHEVFEGNRSDSKTLRDMIDSMERKHGKIGRVWVMDRGMVSEENITFLRERGHSYIVGTPKAMLKRFEGKMVESGWNQVREGIEVKYVRPDGEEETISSEEGGLPKKTDWKPHPGELFLLSRSADRGLKEESMRKRFEKRYLDGLEKLKKAIESGRLNDEGLAHRRLGKLQGDCWRASKCLEVTIRKVESAETGKGKPRLEMEWRENPGYQKWCQQSQGCYLLRTNLKDVPPTELWKQYIQLTEVEAAFRINKEQLELRPVWHQKEDRVKAHILVCFMAYAMWKALGAWMKKAKLGDAPRTLINELAQIKSGDVSIKGITPDGPIRELMVRCVVQPSAEQKVLLNRLGLKVPNQLRRFERIRGIGT
ncbi:MAG: IS1634 family transposase [Bdellovibrio sp.]